MTKLAAHEIVQVVPGHPWAGVLCIVTEPRSWGCIAYARIPLGGDAFIRLTHEEFERVGATARSDRA